MRSFSWQGAWLVCASFLAGCGGATTPSNTPADAATSDVLDRVDAPITPDVVDAAIAQDVVTVSDAARADAGPVPNRGHRSYVPGDLRPTAAARLLVMGDSISAGYGATPRSDAYFTILARNDDAMWPADMAASLQTRFGAAVPVVNVAVAGATTATMRSNQLPALQRMAPFAGHTVVVITIGGNDITTSIATGNPTGAALDTAIANLRATVTFLQNPMNFPGGVSVYVAAVYDPSDGVGFVNGCFFNLRLPSFVSALNVWRDRYVALGTELHFAVVDALGHFHGHGHNHDDPDNPYWDDASHDMWFDDCLHPNNRGHSEMRKLFFEAIDGTYTVTP